MSIAAYKRTIRESESPRQIERRILSQVTGSLELHATLYDAADSREERIQILSTGLRDALAENQRIWTALRNDLTEQGNVLPDGLKASLISIALWVDRQTGSVMGGESGVGMLANVNRNIVAGLSGEKPRPLG